VTTRTKNALGLLLLTASVALAVWFVRRSQPKPPSALDAVPASSFLVLDVDVDLLRKSPLGAPLLEGPGSSLLGGKAVATTCGFDPIERMREVAVAVPLEDDTGEFGIVVRADVTKEVLVDCARKIQKARGAAGGVSFRQSGSFTWVEPEGDLAKRYPTLAYHEGGPYLVARGPWLGTMVDTAAGKLPSARHESRHLALRRELGQTSDEKSAFLFHATVVLPKEMRERLKREMGAELAAEGGDADSQALMAGALDVEGAAFGISADEAPGGEIRALLELDCEDEPACSAVARIIDNKRHDGSKNPSVRLLGAAALLDGLMVEGRGKRLRVSVHAPANQVATWAAQLLERLLEYKRGQSPVTSDAAP
jgi:hypothetical protein